MNFNELYNKITFNRDNYKKGDYNCIPFLNFKRLEAVIPGIEKSCYTLVGASTSVGKSSFVRDLYINNPIRYIENLPENLRNNIKLDILYFSLEQSKERVLTTEMSKHIFLKYKKEVSVNELMSIGRLNCISDEIYNLLPNTKSHIDTFNKYVQIYDSITNPTGIFKIVRNFALQIGSYYRRDGSFYSEDVIKRIKNGQGFTEDEIKDYGGYKTYHPNHYVIVIVDHKSIMTPENGETLRETMYKFSSKYCLHIRDKFGFSPVMVQQFANDKENVETNYQGKTIEEKLEPSTASFADNKSSVKDCDVCIGLFSPYRYNILRYGDYDLTILKNNFRTLHILKNRYGEVGIKIPMFFTGKTGLFRELPKPDDQEIHNYYEYAKKMQLELVNKINS